MYEILVTRPATFFGALTEGGATVAGTMGVGVGGSGAGAGAAGGTPDSPLEVEFESAHAAAERPISIAVAIAAMTALLERCGAGRPARDVERVVMIALRPVESGRFRLRL
jgi:hypothetical protein